LYISIKRFGQINFFYSKKIYMQNVLQIILIIVLLISIVSCDISSPSEPGQTQTITVLAAASLTEPFSELGRRFEAQNPNTKVEFNFAGSQQLAQQLGQGAPADVFASASQKFLDAAVQANRVAKDKAQIFAKNRLVVIYPKENPASLIHLQDLAKPDLKLILVAKDVPVGQYSLDFLDKVSNDPAFSPMFKAAVLKNVVSFEENVKAVYTKISLGEADAGIVYLSDITPDGAGQVGSLDIPDPLNVIAAYPIAPISDSKHLDLAMAFVDLVMSPAGQQVLQKYHFGSASP
jgi:molybdate transport system substrate-binding protein